MELFGNFSSKKPVETHENCTPFINLPLKCGFLNFSSFPSFWTGSIAQNEIPEMPEIFESLKNLNCVGQMLKDFT